jgi:hypothetical protein
VLAKLIFPKIGTKPLKRHALIVFQCASMPAETAGGPPADGKPAAAAGVETAAGG